MSAVLPAPSRDRSTPILPGQWWPILVGLLALYVPTYLSLITDVWANDVNDDYGPVALLVVAFTFWQKREILRAFGTVGNPLSGALLLGFGLVLYVLGRSQGILIVELASQIPVLAGVLLLFRGWSAVRQVWFPLCFIFFMLPFPGVIVQDITGPLKQYDSVLVEHVLYALGYPIARNGVELTIGPYQMLVADACSGLNSIFSLSAMGLLYLYYVRRAGLWRDGLLLAAIVPIAFAANVIRVMVLLLITYYFGDEAGQGFTHGAASILLFAVSLALLFALDYLLTLGRSRTPPASAATS